MYVIKCLSALPAGSGGWVVQSSVITSYGRVVEATSLGKSCSSVCSALMSLYLFPNGKGASRLWPGWGWSLLMSLAFLCRWLAYTVSKFWEHSSSVLLIPPSPRPCPLFSLVQLVYHIRHISRAYSLWCFCRSLLGAEREVWPDGMVGGVKGPWERTSIIVVVSEQQFVTSLSLTGEGVLCIKFF